MSHIIIALKFTLKTQDNKIHYTIHQVRIARNTPSHLMNKNRKTSIDRSFKYRQDTPLAHHVAHHHRTQFTLKTQDDKIHYTIHQVRIARNTPSHLMNKNRKASIDRSFKYLQDTLLAHHVAHRHRTQIHTQNTRQQNPLHYTPSSHSTNTPSHLMNKNRKTSIDRPFKYLQDTPLAHHVAHHHRTQIHTSKHKTTKSTTLYTKFA